MELKTENIESESAEYQVFVEKFKPKKITALISPSSAASASLYPRLTYSGKVKKPYSAAGCYCPSAWLRSAWRKSVKMRSCGNCPRENARLLRG